jgi:hypothetical protein
VGQGLHGWRLDGIDIFRHMIMMQIESQCDDSFDLCFMFINTSPRESSRGGIL